MQSHAGPLAIIAKNNDNDKKKDKTEEAVVDFETAMNAAGFGWFNVYLILAAIPATFASNFETTTMSYILPVAECDLKMTFVEKGVLNATTYAGMIVSAMIWGYLADTLGRKKILVYGYMADAICVIGSSLSQNFQMLVVFKFFGGFIVNGPGAVLFTYLSELHGAKHRPRVLLVIGMVTSLGNLVLPLLAWAIFPRDWDFVLFGSLNIHTWNIFLFVCCLPSLASSLLITILPESPKFLMSQGRNAEALRAFQKIYAFNTRNSRESYPVKHLVEEVPSRDSNANEAIYTIELTRQPAATPASIAKDREHRQHRSFGQALRDGLVQIKPIFHKPLLGHSLHVYTMQFCILLGLNTIRLWLPQLFASIAEFESLQGTEPSDADICKILEFSMNKTTTTVSTQSDLLDCAQHKEISMDMYMNNLIVAFTGLLGYVVASGVVKFAGAHRMLSYGLLISGAFGLSLYWSTSGLVTLILSSTFITVTSVSTSSLLGLVMALFPTSLRTMVVSMAMMFGRLGALAGNVLFPLLVEIGCIPPFIMVSAVLFCAGGLAFILPSGKRATFT